MSPVLHDFAFIFLTWFSIRVDAYPDGQVTAACSSMVPDHGGASPQASTSPYILNVTKTTYSPGEKITVTLTSSTGSPQFKGFLIQARSGNDTTPLGFFQTNSSDSQTLNCTSAASAVSQTNSSGKTSIQITWVAPTSTNASIQIRGTVVQSKTVFWTNVVSSKLSYLAVPNNTASSTTSTTSSTSTLGSNVNVNNGTSVTTATTSVNKQPTSGSPLHSAVSQTNSSGKTSIQMTWVTATSTNASTEIRATVAQSKTVFWTNAVSSKPSYLAVLNNTASSTTPSSSTTSTTTSSSSTLDPNVNVNNGTSVTTTTTSVNEQPNNGSPLHVQNFQAILLSCVVAAFYFMKQ